MATGAWSSKNASIHIGRTLESPLVVPKNTFDELKRAMIIAGSEKEFHELVSSNPNGNVHLIREVESKSQQGQASETFLVYSKSSGSNTELMSQLHMKRFPENETESLLEEVCKQKVVVLSGQPGMGKLVYLLNLAHQTKRHSPLDWIEFVELNDHTKALKNRKGELFRSEDEAVDFLTNIVRRKSQTDHKSLEEQLFRAALRSDALVLMLGGFDDVSPNYTDVVVSLVEQLSGLTKATWITTRSHLSSELEDRFNAARYSLVPLNEAQQRELLIGILLKQLDVKEQQSPRVEDYISAIVKSIGDKIRDQTFANVPLHVRMYADVFTEGAMAYVNATDETPPDVSEIVSNCLFRRFFEYKFRIVLAEKNSAENSADRSNLANSEMVSSIWDDYSQIKCHEVFALMQYFPETTITSLGGVRKMIESKDLQTFARYGLVEYGDDQYGIKFVHKIYAEYLIALFLFKQFKHAPDGQVVDLIFEKALPAEQLRLVRVFFGNFFRDAVFNKGERRCFKERCITLGPSSVRSILYRACTEGNANLVQFLRVVLPMSETVLTDVLGRYSCEKSKNNLWHLAVNSGNQKVALVMFRWCEKFNLDLRDGLLAKGDDGMNVIELATARGHCDILKMLSRWLDIDQSSLGNLLRLSVEKCHLDVFSLLLGWARGMDFEMLFLQNPCPLIHSITKCRVSEMMDKLLEHFPDISGQILCHRDETGLSAWQCRALNSTESSWQSLINLTKSEKIDSELINFLVERDDKDRIFWFNCNDPTRFRRIYETARNEVEPKKLKELLLRSSEAIWHKAASLGDVELFEDILDYASKEEVDLNHILISKNPDGDTVWKIFARNGKNDILERLKIIASEKNIDLEDYLEFCMEETKNPSSVLRMR